MTIPRCYYCEGATAPCSDCLNRHLNPPLTTVTLMTSRDISHEIELQSEVAALRQQVAEAEQRSGEVIAAWAELEQRGAAAEQTLAAWRELLTDIANHQPFDAGFALMTVQRWAKRAKALLPAAPHGGEHDKETT